MTGSVRELNRGFIGRGSCGQALSVSDLSSSALQLAPGSVFCADSVVSFAHDKLQLAVLLTIAFAGRSLSWLY